MKPLEKKNTRFNLFDAAVIFILVLLLIGLILYMIPKSAGGEPATLRVTCSGVRADFLPLISKDDIVYSQNGKTTLGRISKVTTAQDTLTLTDSEGDSQTAKYPVGTLYKVTLEIAATNVTYLQETDSISLGALNLAPGESLALRTTRVSLTGTCDSFELKGGAK